MSTRFAKNDVGWQLLVVATDNHRFTPIQRGQSELYRHLRGLVVYDHVEYSAEGKHAACHIWPHKPYRPDLLQTDVPPQIHELPKPARRGPVKRVMSSHLLRVPSCPDQYWL
jgi:hypothetical protein